MDSVFKALKTKFDASPTLVPSPFQAGLYLQEPPDTTQPGGQWPFVVLLNPGDRVKTKRLFGGQHEVWSFPCVFQVVHFNEAYAGSCCRLIDTVFGVPLWQPTLTDTDPYQYRVVSWRNDGGLPQQLRDDVWSCTTQYQIVYHRLWNG